MARQNPDLEPSTPSSCASSKLSWERSGKGAPAASCLGAGDPHPMHLPPCTFFKNLGHPAMTQVPALSLCPQAKSTHLSGRGQLKQDFLSSGVLGREGSLLSTERSPGGAGTERWPWQSQSGKVCGQRLLSSSLQPHTRLHHAYLLVQSSPAVPVWLVLGWRWVIMSD